MIPFIELHTYTRAAVLAVLFVCACLFVCLTFWSIHQKTFVPKIISPLCGFLCLLFLLPYAAFIFADQRNGFVVGYAYVDAFLSLSAISVLAVAVSMLLILMGMFLYFFKKVRENITIFSVKESLDKLKTGVCFAYENGMIKLINRQMDALHRTILGYEMRSAADFLAELKNGILQPGVERLSYGEKTVLRLPDASVWSFSVKKQGAMYEITAADTTDLYRVTEELQLSNTELSAMNERLQKYGENVDALTKARERLETKYRIHAEFGNALLATRLFLQNDDKDPNDIMNLWRRNITVLGAEQDSPLAYDALNGLITAAKAVGIRVDMTGEMPEKESVRKLFLESTAEALTNAVRHADAKEFRVTFSQDLFCYSATFCNDLQREIPNISEGGGLSSIRRKTEMLGGKMTVYTQPQFTLRLVIPK